MEPPPPTADEMAALIRRYLHNRNTPPNVEVGLRELLTGMARYRSPEIFAGINAGVQLGWWLDGPNGRIIPTAQGVRQD